MKKKYNMLIIVLILGFVMFNGFLPVYADEKESDVTITIFKGSKNKFDSTNPNLKEKETQKKLPQTSELDNSSYSKLGILIILIGIVGIKTNNQKKWRVIK